MGRRDGRFHEARYVAEPYGHVVIYEEPSAPDPEPGDARIVGNVILAMNGRGLFRWENGVGLNGEFVQVSMSSLSNPDALAAPTDFVRSALVQFNPKRLGGGFVRVYLRRQDFPDSEGMTVEQLRKESTDGRTLAALGAFFAHNPRKSVAQYLRELLARFIR